ncbi:MAG: hypothetical protein LBC37_05915, partial [Zoogloeaceae bacterium]|nr:hypothetical protein [Zoogloeaceae bacterium]
MNRKQETGDRLDEVLDPSAFHHAADAISASAVRAHDAGTSLDAALTAVSDILLGKPETVRLALACLIAGGHLLLEDLPGMG